MDELELPIAVHALQQALPQLGPNPPRVIAWRLDLPHYVVIFEDGRKLRTLAPEQIAGSAAYDTKQKGKGKKK